MPLGCLQPKLVVAQNKNNQKVEICPMKYHNEFETISHLMHAKIKMQTTIQVIFLVNILEKTIDFIHRCHL